MLVFNSEKTIRTEWDRPLISRANKELSKILNLPIGNEIYKIKRYIYSVEDQSIYAFGVAYLPVIKDLSEYGFLENTSAADIIEQVYSLKNVKIGSTNVALCLSDQVLSTEMECDLYTNLLNIRQIVLDKNKVICVNVLYVNALYGELAFGSLPELI